MAHEILLVEDHRDIAEMVAAHLERDNFVIDYADNGNLGYNLGRENSYDAIVLDVMLPGIDGLTVCKKLRHENAVRCPILMLTARDTLEDKLMGFDVGADDYLLKPFDLEELSARLKALIRRTQGKGVSQKLQVSDLVLDQNTQKVFRDKQEIILTPICRKILAILMSESPGVVHKKEIEKFIWSDSPPDSDALRSHIYALRKSIDKPFASPLIHTVPSVGWRLQAIDEDRKASQ